VQRSGIRAWRSVPTSWASICRGVLHTSGQTQMPSGFHVVIGGGSIRALANQGDGRGSRIDARGRYTVRARAGRMQYAPTTPLASLASGLKAGLRRSDDVRISEARLNTGRAIAPPQTHLDEREMNFD